MHETFGHQNQTQYLHRVIFLGWEVNNLFYLEWIIDFFGDHIFQSDLPGKGLHPECDPWGRPFSENYHPKRAQKANTRIAGRFHMVLDGVQGDADFIAAIFKLRRCIAGIRESRWLYKPIIPFISHLFLTVSYPGRCSLLLDLLDDRECSRFLSTYPVLLSLQCSGNWSAWVFVHKLGPSSSIQRWVAWPKPAVSKSPWQSQE